MHVFVSRQRGTSGERNWFGLYQSCRAVLQHKLMLLFWVGIVHTNLYNCIS